MSEEIAITDFIYEANGGTACYRCICCKAKVLIAFTYFDSDIGFVCIDCLKKAVEIMEVSNGNN